MRRAIFAAVAFAVPLYAERSTNYVPPVYAVRFACSLLTLSMLALPGLLVAAAVARRTRERTMRRTAAAVAITLLFVAFGSAVAATDAMNEESWNPARYGSYFIAASFPAAIAAASSREDPGRVSIIVLAIMAAFPLALIVSAIGPIFASWAYDHGIPATW